MVAPLPIETPNQAAIDLVARLIAAESWVPAALGSALLPNAQPDLPALLHQARIALQQALDEQSRRISEAQAVAMAQDARNIVTAAQQQLLGAIITSSDDAILSVDPTGIVTSWNRGAQRLFGYTAAEMIGQSVGMLMTEENPHEHCLLLDKINGGEHIAHHETIRRRKDGREVPVSLTMFPIFDAAGEIIGASKISRDISERKQADADLRQAIKKEQDARTQAEDLQERLAFLLEASTFLADAINYRERLQQLAQLAIPRLADWCVVDVMDTDGKMRRLAASHIDPTKVNTLSQFVDRFPPHIHLPVGLRQVLETKQALLVPDTTILRQYVQNEPERLAAVDMLGLNSLMIVPLIARDRVLGVVSFAIIGFERRYQERDLELAKDLTNRSALLIENARLYDEAQQINVELEVRVAQRTAQLEIANQELEAFSYSVSHDLRTPLRAIDGFSRMIIRDYDATLPEEGQRRLRVIRENAQQMGQLIDDLLIFSRLNRQPLIKQPIDMPDLVRRALEKLNFEQQNRQIEITIGEMPPANGDPTLLQQVLLNLLSNALKFTRPRAIAQITIGYENSPSQGKSAYFIRDNGVGFDMQYVDKLFGVFQRLHRPEDFEGTGVGLAIVQRVIHRHGGQVWAEAALDQGATFYFVL